MTRRKEEVTDERITQMASLLDPGKRPANILKWKFALLWKASMALAHHSWLWLQFGQHQDARLIKQSPVNPLAQMQSPHGLRF